MPGTGSGTPSRSHCSASGTLLLPVPARQVVLVLLPLWHRDGGGTSRLVLLVDSESESDSDCTAVLAVLQFSIPKLLASVLVHVVLLQLELVHVLAVLA